MGSYKWVISRVTIVITHLRGLITPLITTHEPPSNLAFPTAEAKDSGACTSQPPTVVR